MTVTDAIDDIAGRLRRGELIEAYDRARQCLDAGEDHPRLRYLTVLALARSGATAQAASQYRALGLHRIGDVDCASLWARIRKDFALSAPRPERRHLLARAAAAYAFVFRRTDDYFPGINAATLALLAGRDVEARELAGRLLRSPALAAPESYYAAASRAEALIILRRWREAADALTAARLLAGEDFGAVSTTRRQLSLLLDALVPGNDLVRDFLLILSLPRVAHVAGAEIEPDRAAERGLDGAIDAILSEEEIGFGVGPLWTAGDLLLAERLLARRAELHLVLPFAPAGYLAYIRETRPGEEADRRAACLERATTITTATGDGDFADPNLIDYATQIADGLAQTRARRLATECVEVALTVAGGDTDRKGFPLRRTRTVTADAGPPLARPPIPADMPEREVRAILFADVFRFSTIPESRLPGFWSTFMAALAKVIDEAGAHVLYRNTWGDALFLVIGDIRAAADLALSIQERAAELRHGNRTAPLLRIGLHHGPVFRGFDPIRGIPAYFGTQVSRAARVEPVAPPGAVFVTEPFAALLAVNGADGFEAEYVGLTPLPKKYGEHRMYRLARRAIVGAEPAA